MTTKPPCLAQPEYEGVEAHRIDLVVPLLVIKGRRGILACGYLSVATMNKLGEAGAIVTGVRDYEDMLRAQVVSVSERAEQLGVTVEMSGREALIILNAHGAENSLGSTEELR
jgi:uncharacterized protein YunC (DUF1805 family)